jgi:Tfp pilus assembly protein PilW
MGRMSGGSCSGALSPDKSFYGNERGIMLIDLLLGLALALLLLGILQQVAGLVFKGYSASSNQAELQYASRMAIDCIQQDIRAARDFQVSADGSRLTISGANGDNVSIYAKYGNLYRTYEGTAVPMAENLAAVNFIKSGSRLRCELKLHSQDDDYEVNFFCFSRVLQMQE